MSNDSTITERPRLLDEVWLPRRIQLDLSSVLPQIIEAEAELIQHAESNSDRCFGYFPGLLKRGIKQDLPASEEFARTLPDIDVDGEFPFNFLRLSLKPQPRHSSWHLDSDAISAVSGDVQTLAERRVWRVLFNLSASDIRAVEYLPVDPATVLLHHQGGYVSLGNEADVPVSPERMLLGRRDEGCVEGVVFCASQVFHRGNDGDSGHFVAGYGREEVA